MLVIPIMPGNYKTACGNAAKRSGEYQAVKGLAITLGVI